MSLLWNLISCITEGPEQKGISNLFAVVYHVCFSTFIFDSSEKFLRMEGINPVAKPDHKIYFGSRNMKITPVHRSNGNQYQKKTKKHSQPQNTDMFNKQWLLFTDYVQKNVLLAAVHEAITISKIHLLRQSVHRGED